MTEENFKGGVYDQSFAPQDASYVMVEVTEAKTGGDCGWVAKEIEVYGVKGDSANELSAKQAAGGILSVPRYTGAGELVYPKTPAGFTVTIESSSNEKIIALEGTVTPGMYDETVYLQFKVVKDSDKEES